MARKPIPKSLRFEAFKRDKFTCQYCGATAPEVVLEIDHIKPVSKGGDNSILNLVTACKECNRGKSNRLLSDNSAVKIQRKQLEDIQDRREQLEMMLRWRTELVEETEIEVNSINELFANFTKWEMSDNGKNGIRKLIRRFGFNEVYEATEIAISKYYFGDSASWDNAYNKIGGICFNRKKASDEDA